jgi:hypothetical protein
MSKKYRQAIQPWNNLPTNAAVTIPVSALGSSYTNVSLTSTGTYTYSSSWDDALKPNSIHVKGDAEFHGNIRWQGRDMREWFDSVESRLAMLQPNPELEKDWEELSRIRMQYVELERKLLEQQRVYNILKKD